jgi:hypothetical protein
MKSDGYTYGERLLLLTYSYIINVWIMAHCDCIHCSLVMIGGTGLPRRHTPVSSSGDEVSGPGVKGIIRDFDETAWPNGVLL